VRSLQPGRIDLIVHILLAGLTVGSMSLVLWQNCDTIREVLGHKG
jgi:hypothetical protein